MYIQFCHLLVDWRETNVNPILRDGLSLSPGVLVADVPNGQLCRWRPGRKPDLRRPISLDITFADTRKITTTANTVTVELGRKMDREEKERVSGRGL